MNVDDDRSPPGADSDLGPPTVHGDLPRYWLDYRGHQFELRLGEVVLGRSAGCQLVLEDVLVSRRHARIFRDAHEVTVEDLGSANGVYVNGERITSPVQVSVGDRIVVGQQEMVLRAGIVSDRQIARRRFSAITMTGMEDPPEVDQDRTHEGDALTLLGGVADKVLALKRGEEAERILGTFLRNLLERAREGAVPDPKFAERAASYALKLAGVTGRGTWADFAVELFLLVGQPMPAPLIDELYRILRQLKGFGQQGLKTYLSALRKKQDQFGPAERFLVQRLEGLERLAGL